MQDGCKVYMDSYIASNGSCFMFTWTIFQNHLLEVDLTQNQETMALCRSQPLLYSVMSCTRNTWIEIHWNSIWLRAPSHMTSHYTWRFVTTLHDFGGVMRRPLDTFVWALTMSWSRLLARGEVAMSHNGLRSHSFGKTCSCCYSQFWIRFHIQKHWNLVFFIFFLTL